jgi:hypothetical protein
LLFAESGKHQDHSDIEESRSFSWHNKEDRQKAEGHEEKKASNHEKDGKKFVVLSVSLQVSRFLSQSIPLLLNRSHDATVFVLVLVN